MTLLTPIEHPKPTNPEGFARTTAQVSAAFSKLLEQWKIDTRLTSDSVAILMHPAHYKIIGLGPQVLPNIFADLANGGGPWFLALESITHENPVTPEHLKSAKLMRADWIQWGIEHGYLPA